MGDGDLNKSVDRNTEDKADWMSRGMWAGIGIISIIVVACIVYAGALAWPQMANCYPKWLAAGWVADYMQELSPPPTTCLDLNEFGDLLAGTFAPLAFLLLIMATLLQSLELRAQRKEIALSRNVAKDQRLAMVAQAKEAKASAAALKAQADAMKLERELRDQEAARMEFSLGQEHLRGTIEEVRFVNVPGGQRRKPYTVYRLLPLYAGAALDKELEGLNSKEAEAAVLVWQYRNTFVGLAALKERLSTIDRQIYEDHHFAQLGEIAQQLDKFVKAHPNSIDNIFDAFSTPSDGAQSQ